MKPIRCLAAVALLVVSSAVVRAEPEPARDDGPSMANAVRMKVPAVEFKAVALVDVFDFMRDVAKLNIHVNWPALEAVGIDRSTPITIRLRQIALSKVLDLTLREVSAGAAPITWYVSDNIIHVTTRDLADRDMITRVYPVQDLLVEVPNFRGPTFQLGSGSGGGGDSGGGSVFTGGDDASGEQNTTMQERGERLVELIKMLVSPDVWVDNGGYSQIRYFNGTIIVTAPRSVQVQIGN